jgi:hypothetical protein
MELREIPPMVAAHPLKMVVEAKIPAKATGRMTDSTFATTETGPRFPRTWGRSRQLERFTNCNFDAALYMKLKFESIFELTVLHKSQVHAALVSARVSRYTPFIVARLTGIYTFFINASLSRSHTTLTWKEPKWLAKRSP